MVATKGLAHLHLKVSDLDRSIRFYASLGFEPVADKHAGTQVFLGNDAGDLLTLSAGPNPGEYGDSSRHVGENGGIDHFGFALVDQTQMPQVIDELVAAGATLVDTAELAPGWPTAFLRDPDGYVFQL
jgi:catechol 2,3-dioxygenase-like lactoylglutathione lyase family enzyme